MTDTRKTIVDSCGAIQMHSYDKLADIRDRINDILAVYGNTVTVQREYDHGTEYDEWFVYRDRVENDEELAARLIAEKRELEHHNRKEYEAFVRLNAKYGGFTPS